MIDLLRIVENFVYKITIYTNQRDNSYKNPIFIILSLLVFAIILLAYSNHFSNDFQFDDLHSIKFNNSIREIDVKKFFIDGTTISTLPTNQSYRPYLTLENAIDYKLSGGSGTKIFHIHIFIVFLIVCILICVFVKKILDKINYSSYNQFWGLLVAAAFGLLCANAETVNYIYQRAEIDSALYILAGLIAFVHGGNWRNKYIYLLFPLIGFFAKEMTFVFAPLLLLYILIFEENVDLLHFYRIEELKKCNSAIKKTLPAIILTFIFLIFYILMLPASWTPGGTNGNSFLYLITQPMVMCHYIFSYFIPYNLSADTDWSVFPSIFDYRSIIGITLIFCLIYIALKVSKNKNSRLFSFGVLWFFIALIPTSSFIAFAEVLNDHRPFIPYIGLTIAFIFGTKYVLEEYFPRAIKKKSTQNIIVTLLIIFLGSNAYGVHQRNKVWKDGMSLWYDVTIKSPKNGRGLMNYGTELMAIGDYSNAEKYFNRAASLLPNYSRVYINLGIVKSATGDLVAAENYFKKAVSLPINVHISWYYYGRFLSEQGRFEDAKVCLNNSLKILPNYYLAKEILMEIFHKTNDWENLKNIAQSILQTLPNDINAIKYLDISKNKKSLDEMLEEDAANMQTPEKYLDLSLKYFQMNKFSKSIIAANKAINLKSNYPAAYNNIGIANFKLREYDIAIQAYNKALSLNPNYQLAKNNLVNVIALKSEKWTSAIYLVTADDFLNLSLAFYKERKYAECIEAAKRSIIITPNADAYNNICAAYNQLKQYDKAIEAGENALRIDSSHMLAMGNLDFAVKQKIQNSDKTKIQDKNTF